MRAHRFPRSLWLAFVFTAAAICTAGVQAATRSNAPKMPTNAPQYKIPLDNDHRLCTALGSFYARHLVDAASEGGSNVEERFPGELTSSGITFLTGQQQPEIDIYNDGSRRFVFFVTGNPFALSDQMVILRPEDDRRGIDQLLNGLGPEIDQRVEQWIDFALGGSSIALPLTTIGASSLHLLRYEGKNYGVARSLASDERARGKITDSTIVAFLLARSGTLTNICQIEFHSQAETGARAR